MLCYSWFSWAPVPFGGASKHQQHNGCFARGPVPFGNTKIATVALSHANSHYYSTGPAEPTFCLCMISWTCFRSELTCKATDTDKFVWVYVCECVWTRTGAASKRCFYEPIKRHCYAIAWGTPQGNKQLKVSALQRRWSGSGITHNFF